MTVTTWNIIGHRVIGLRRSILRSFLHLLLAVGLLGAILWPTHPQAGEAAPLPTPSGFENYTGAKLGGFQLSTKLQAGLKATDNIRLDPSQKNDVMQLLNLNTAAKSDWLKHALAATASYLSQKASETTDENTHALSATLSGRIDINNELNFKLGTLRQESIIGKNNPLQFSGLLHGTSRSNIIEAGLEWDNKKAFINLLGRHLKTTTHNEIDLIEFSEFQNLDRNESELTLQVGKHWKWGEYYLLAGPQEARYTGSTTILSEDRDSTGGRLGAGIEFEQNDLQGIIRIIAFRQYFDAPSIPDVKSTVGTAQLIYKIDDRWSLSGILERNFDETNITSSGGLFTNLAAFGILYVPRKDLYFKLSPAYRLYEIANTSYEARSTALDASLSWQITERIELLTNVTLSNQTVNDSFLSNYDYSEKALTLSAVITL
jgi:hypothetical protein